MKEKIRKNWPIYIVILFLFSVSLIVVVMEVNKNNNELKEVYKNQHVLASDIEEYKNFYEIYGSFNQNIKDFKLEATTMFTRLSRNTVISIILFELTPLIVMFCSLYEVNKYVKKGVLNNFLTRIDYKKFIKKIYAIAWKWALIIPAFWLVFFIMCIIASKNIGINQAIVLSNYSFIHILLFIVFTLVDAILCCNIGLICLSKSKNITIACFSGYLIYFTFNFYTEIILDAGIMGFLGIDKYNSFGLTNLHFSLSSNNYLYADTYLELVTKAFTLLLFLSYSFLILKYMYNNKERLLNDE